MGSKPLHVVIDAISIFNEKVKGHDICFYVQYVKKVKSNKSEISYLEFQLIEKAFPIVYSERSMIINF